MTAPTMVDHALGLAARGFEVFPCNGKVPAIPGGSGCLDATDDRIVIAKMWAGRPMANIGVRIPVGQLVVDVDPRHDGHDRLAELESRHGSLPPTRTSASGRDDGGIHLWWLRPSGAVTATRLGRGIDLKDRGGYVVAPPSRHPDTGRPYRWLDVRTPVEMPKWLSDLIRPAPTPTTVRRLVIAAPGRRLEALVQTVMDSIEGTRNGRLFWASCRGHEAVLEGQYDERTVRMALTLAGEAVGLPAGEVEKTIGSAFVPGRVSA